MNIQVILLAVALVMLYIELLRLATRSTSGDYTTKVKVVTVTATAIVAISLTIAGVKVVRGISDDIQKDEEIITSSPEGPSAGTEKKIIIERVERSYAIGDTNRHCSGPKNRAWQVEATEGWKIDISTIKFAPTVRSSKSVYIGVTDRSENGFTIRGRIVNRGNCVLGFRDARGTLRVAGTYEEFRETTQ